MSKQDHTNFINPFKPGDVIYNSWGYEQTNIDFYEVIRATAKTVLLREIEGKTTASGFMSGYIVPAPGAYKSEETTRHHVRQYGNNHFIVLFKYGCGYKYDDGQRLRCSWYA